MHGQNQSLKELGTNCCSVSPSAEEAMRSRGCSGAPVVTEEGICEAGACVCPLPGTFPNTKKKSIKDHSFSNSQHYHVSLNSTKFVF